MKNTVRSICLLLIIILLTSGEYLSAKTVEPDETIFVFGGDIHPKFIQKVADWTKKENPKICYIPTASADNDGNEQYWNSICDNLSIESHVLKVWVSSADVTETFEEKLLRMDAIVVGGGNTLNMLGIWRAQGIDKVLKKAIKSGIVVAGGSAGSICWFRNGISDSRPVKLSIVDGLGILPFSNCPHYSDSTRREMYHEKVRTGLMGAGYGSDDLSALLFVNGKFVQAYSINDTNDSYFISRKQGRIVTQKLNPEYILTRGAISKGEYDVIDIDKSLGEFPEIFDQKTPLNAFVSVMYTMANGENSKHKLMASHYIKDKLSDQDSGYDDKRKQSYLDIRIHKMLVYNDSVAGVINKVYRDFYSLRILYKENGEWKSAGEDIGGDTVFESEITFREKAAMHLRRVRESSK